jgi:DGQHR domain-containing protein
MKPPKSSPSSLGTAARRRASSAMKRTPTYPALLLSQNNHRFYFATIPVDDLFSYCFVSRRSEDPLAGFQRTLAENRADDIAGYLRSGTGSIPTNIVLSAQPDAVFVYTRRTKSIAFTRTEKAFLVIDGQHRLWGYEKCTKRHRVPVSIYAGLDRAQEARLFIDINTNQRGVPAALLLDIKQIAAIEGMRETILRDIFDRLSTDTSSPLVGRLSPAKSIAGKISRVTFNRAVGAALEAGVVEGMDADARYRLVLNYLNAFDAELLDKKMLVRSAFFEAIFDLLDEVVRVTISAHSNAKLDSLRHTIRPLAQIDFSSALGGRTTLTKKALTNLMQATLRQTLRISADML